MKKISQEKIDEIRNSVNIVDVISNYVPLTSRGKNYFGICPFHDDNNPSMSVNNEKKIYKCFSCGATGTVFKFIMDYENISFLEAVKKIADIARIPLNIGPIEKTNNNNELYKIYDLSLKFYTNNINTPSGKKAKKYLKDRGISDELIKEFQIGLSSNGKDDLSKILLKKFKHEDLLKTGLLGKNEYGFYDLFHERIMFPLYDLNGQAVAYSGRVYSTIDSSKYINTKETEIFKKGELLYNYHRAKEIARKKNQIIVMEGFMDVIRAHSIGIKNVIALMGTAITQKQANLIKKMAMEVILCFDGDSAGIKATLSCAEELIKIGVVPNIICLDNVDPDEYIQKFGKEKFELEIKNPISFVDFKLNILKGDLDIKSSTAVAKYVTDSITEIQKIDDDILRDIYIKKLAKETNVSEDLIKSKISDKKIIIKQKISKPEKTTKYEVAQRNLLNYMLKSSEVIKMYNNKITYIPNKEYRLLAREISNFFKHNGFINIANLIDYVECDNDLLETINKIEKANLNEKYTIEEIEDYIRVIKNYNIRNETNRLKDEMKKELDPLKKAQIAQKIIDLKKECNNV